MGKTGRSRGRPTQADVAREVGVDPSTVSKILSGSQVASFSPGTAKRVLKIARELGYDLARMKHAHRRAAPRKELSIRAEATLLLEDGTAYDEGIVTLRDLSTGGARATDLEFPRRSAPVLPFLAALRAIEGPLQSFEMTGLVVRVYFSREISLGIRFSTLPVPVMDRLKKLVARLR